MLAGAQADAGMAWGEVRIVEVEIAFTASDVDLLAGQGV
jgi:hypothetical protein